MTLELVITSVVALLGIMASMKLGVSGHRIQKQELALKKKELELDEQIRNINKAQEKEREKYIGEGKLKNLSSSVVNIRQRIDSVPISKLSSGEMVAVSLIFIGDALWGLNRDLCGQSQSSYLNGKAESVPAKLSESFKSITLALEKIAGEKN